MKKLLTHIFILLVAATCTVSSQAASQAKVRTALNFAANMSKTVLSTARAHKYKTFMAATGAAAIAYAKYRHGWYDREVTRLAKEQRRLKACRTGVIEACDTGVIKNALSRDNFACPDAIVDLIKEYADTDYNNQEVVTALTLNRARRQAHATQELTFTHFLTTHANNRNRRLGLAFIAMGSSATLGMPFLDTWNKLFPYNNFLRYISFFSILGFEVLLLQQNLVAGGDGWFSHSRRGIYITLSKEIFERPEKNFVNFHALFKDVTQDTALVFKNTGKYFGLPCAVIGMSSVIKAWLDERDRLAWEAAAAPLAA